MPAKTDTRRQFRNFSTILAKVNFLSSATLISPMDCLILGRLDNKLNEPELVKITSIPKKAGGNINLTSE
jgi:hypothetical protein